MADSLVQGKLRFDTSQIDKQLADIRTSLNEVKKYAAQAKASSGGSGSRGGKAEDDQSRALRQQKVYTDDMTKAYKEYVDALKSGNGQLRQYWSNSIEDAKQNINVLKETVAQTDKTTEAYARFQKAYKDSEANAIKHGDVVKRTLEDMRKAEEQRLAALAKTQQLEREAADAANKQQMAAGGVGFAQAMAKQADENAKAVAKSYTEMAKAGVAASKEIANAFAEQDKQAAQNAKAQAKSYEEMAKAGMNAAKAISKAFTKEETQKTKNDVKAVEDAYRRLDEARRKYISSLQAGDESGAQHWNEEIQKTKELIPQLEQAANAHQLNATQTQKLANLKGDAAANESKFNAQVEKTNASLNKQTGEIDKSQKQMQQMVAQAERWIATMVVMRGLRNMWNGMTEYAKSYYDAMNEIRIVTGYTEEQAEHLGASYRALAADMSVSSQEIAKAAVEYWRQGLDESQVNERLKYTTVYAKISAMEFDEAAKLMTAATNAMGLSADRVADVWAYLGDASASGANEIGIAMQKVAAVADQAGISFEWLGSYIATLSEKTRLAPEAIGTAMNSILSRLQQIKQKGFNDEDVYKINDIAKALGSLEKPIALMDEATGEWRNFPDILNDIADQWGNLTDKEQAYIATTMGGTRQRNFLLTLLNDLSKSAEGGSRAWELYAGAQNAAGVAMEKYAIYEESVEAAQGRLNAALEEFYSSIMNGGMLKSWYDGLAGIVGVLNSATDATGGWNIKLTAQAAGVVLISGALKAAGGAGSVFSTILSSVGIGATTAAGGVSMLNVALAATVAGAVVLGITAIAGALLSLATNADKAAENTKKLSDSLSSRRSENGGIADSLAEIKKLSGSLTGTKKDVESFNAARAKIVAAYPELKEVLSDEVSKVGQVAGAYENLIGVLEKYSESQIKRNWAEAHAGINDATKTYASGRSAYTNGLTFTEQNTLSSARSMMERNGGFLQAYPFKMSDLNNLSSVNAYQEYIALFQENIKAMETYILNNEGAVNETMYQMLDGWRNTLYTVLMPGLDSMMTDANEKILTSVETIVTNALNTYEDADVIGAIPSIINGLMKRDWINGGNIYSKEEVEEMAHAAMQTYRDTIEMVNNYVDQYEYDGVSTMADAVFNGLLNQLRDAYVPEEEIREILGRFYEAIGRTQEELLADMTGSEGGTSGKSSETDYDAQLAEAFELLEKLQGLREAIAELGESGALSESIVEAIKGSLGEEAWQEILDGAVNDFGKLDFSVLMEALQAALADQELGADGLLYLLGLNEDSEAAVQAAIEQLAEAADVEKLAEIWATIPEKTKKAMGEAGEEIENFLAYTAKDAEDSVGKIENALKRLERATQLKNLIDTQSVWEDLDSIVDDLTATTEKAASAVSDIQDKLNDAGTAAGALEAAMAGDQTALEYLANLTGLTADQLANNLTPAELMVAEMGDQATLSMEYLANMLVGLNAIQLDATGKIVPIQSLEAAANSCGMTVAALANVVAMFNGSSITWSRTADGLGLRAKAVVPKITWNGSSGGSAKKSSGGGGSGKKSGGGGGGGGSGSNSVSELVEAMLDEFDRVNALRDHRRELAQMGQSYHEARGEIQGVIAYLQMERDIVEEDTVALESYLNQLESQIEANRAIVTTEAAGSKAYNQAMIDLDKLQEEHQKYSKTLIQNKTDVENLTDAIKKQYDKIRQMEIDLRNTILEAIEDREAANERMLSGRIAMEEEIMDRIKKRYEAERDQIIETQDARKSALEDEIDQIDELLAQRKKLAEQDDKMKEIAELEAQIMRISADPTRQKEALQLRQKLAKLREDMAWDAAEAEAQAQKDSIKKQITSIEDYIKYVNDYYEELFKNPQKLIEEMQEILTWTDDQIIAWLKKNTEDYYNQTEAVQRRMVNEWQETLDDMRDTIRTHWDEVETIIAGGADNIINFMMTYSQKYREAGKLQAEAYVDEWKQQLKDLENAYKQVNANIKSYDYVKTTKVDSGSSGGGGGGGGGTGTTTTTTKKEYQFGWRNASGVWTKAAASTNPAYALDNAKKAALAYWTSMNVPNMARIMEDINSATYTSTGNYIKKYALGGMNTTTGLAWLDGTPGKPERILSSYQTELFEDMINTLHQIRSVSTGGILSAPKLAAGGTLPNIDQVVINIEQLNSDTDYDDAAERLMNAFYTKVARSRPVGGIQGW